MVQRSFAEQGQALERTVCLAGNGFLMYVQCVPPNNANGPTSSFGRVSELDAGADFILVLYGR